MSKLLHRISEISAGLLAAHLALWAIYWSTGQILLFFVANPYQERVGPLLSASTILWLAIFSLTTQLSQSVNPK